MADETKVGGIKIELELDSSDMTADINEACKRVQERIESSFEDAWNRAEKKGGSANRSVKKQMDDMAHRSKTTADKMQSNLSGSFGSIAKKAAVAFGSIFAVKKLAEFGKKCLELGSDLEEVQNVVDVTFPRMSARVNEFAQNAAQSFGLSETMAKQFTGTFGAMAKSFGFTESAAYEMSSTLTGLAGDVASFYNISQNEAYTKLKSVFTGETETLKDLGVVMTQSALDMYAMANGFGKTTQAMSEAEKVALRYQFVQDKLAAAQGDFARTSGSWANQVRILKLQMDSFMATVGQGFINLLTPVLKVINTIIGKIISLANAFKAFTELITGKKGAGSSGGVAQVASAGDVAAQSLDNAAGSAGNLAGATKAAGDAATATAKKMRQLMGFDAINKLSDNSNTSSGSGSSGGSGGSGGASGETYDFGELEAGETILDEYAGKFQKIIEKAKELAELFKKGFEVGFGDSEKNIRRIQEACDRIGSTLRDIFTDPEVVASAENLADSIALNLGKITGSVANIGIALATNLAEGIARSLEEQKGFIKEKLSSIFTLEADWWNVSGDFAAALGDIISSAITSNSAVQITSDIVSILTQCFLNAFELIQKLKLDITSMVLTPITENKEKIKKAIEDTLEPISVVVGTIKKAFTDAFKEINKGAVALSD